MLCYFILFQRLVVRLKTTIQAGISCVNTGSVHTPPFSLSWTAKLSNCQTARLCNSRHSVDYRPTPVACTVGLHRWPTTTVHPRRIRKIGASGTCPYVCITLQSHMTVSRHHIAPLGWFKMPVNPVLLESGLVEYIFADSPCCIRLRSNGF